MQQYFIPRFHGDMGSVMAGQSAGLVKEQMSCQELIRKLVKETDALLKGTGIYE